MILSIPFVFTLLAAARAGTSFRPRDYAKQVAICSTSRDDQMGDGLASVKIHYVDVNPDGARTMLMVHGWPSLWSTWSNQIQEFKDEYHLVVPDLRGFGSSTHADENTISVSMAELVGDLVCVLQHARVNSAICVGHDWGSQVCYEAARMRPDIFTAVVGITVPYLPSNAEFIPIRTLVHALPRLAYQLFFDRDHAAATAQLDQDIRRTIRATHRTADSPPPDAFLTHHDSFLEGWKDVEEIPPVPFLTLDEEDYMVEQYAIQGFGGTLHFYKTENRHASWQFANRQANHTITQPVLSILPINDPVADWVEAAKLLRSADHLPDLTMVALPGAHWVHMENPKEVNEAVRTWMKGMHGPRLNRVTDEL